MPKTNRNVKIENRTFFNWICRFFNVYERKISTFFDVSIIMKLEYVVCLIIGRERKKCFYSVIEQYFLFNKINCICFYVIKSRKCCTDCNYLFWMTKKELENEKKFQRNLRRHVKLQGKYHHIYWMKVIIH